MNKKMFFNKFQEELVFVVVFFILIVAMIFKMPKLEYIDFKLIFILFDLMIIVYIFEKSRVLESIAMKVLNNSKNLRQLIFSLIILSFFISMLLTNDVALFLIIPLTLIVEIELKKNLIFPVVLITIAANLGSSVTPFGNPQNLFLFLFYNFNIINFLKITLPLGIISFVLLSATLIFIEKKEFKREFPAVHFTSKSKVIYFSILFFILILSIFGLINYILITIILLISVLMFERKALFKIDYFLLLTFVFIFLIVGNISSSVYIKELFDKFITSSNRVYFLSIFSSQIISNVPAAILISHFSDNAKELILGVNIGGIGTLISSLASLISYKLYTKKKKKMKKKVYLKLFIYWNALFLLVLTLFFYKIKFLSIVF